MKMHEPLVPLEVYQQQIESVSRIHEAHNALEAVLGLTQIRKQNKQLVERNRRLELVQRKLEMQREHLTQRLKRQSRRAMVWAVIVSCLSFVQSIMASLGTNQMTDGNLETNTQGLNLVCLAAGLWFLSLFASLVQGWLDGRD